MQIIEVPSTSSRVEVEQQAGRGEEQGGDSKRSSGSLKERRVQAVSTAVPLRRRRARTRDSERHGRSSRRAPSIGRPLDRSASRRRGLRRASSSLAAARADVRRMRQRRRIVVDPLATTEEAAEAKQLAKMNSELEKGKRVDPDGVSSRYYYRSCLQGRLESPVFCETSYLTSLG